MNDESTTLAYIRELHDDDTSALVAVMLAYAAQNDEPPRPRGSVAGRKPNFDRGAEDAHDRLIRDYFAEFPVYSPRLFRRRFRMQKSLYLRIVNAIESHDSYFQQRPDATKKLGLSALQKCTAAIRQLAYGVPADAVDEYVRIGESTAVESVLRFCGAVIDLFGEEFLRAPTDADVQRLLTLHEQRGFVGMLGSLDCMHWEWKNCPVAWAGQYKGKEKKQTIVLEAVASSDLWIWHAFFGMPGSNNDINVLDRSDLFIDATNTQSPQCNYDINRNNYDIGYYLTDGIYPPWATLVQTISNPIDNKQKYFAKKQEAARKDVERAFGVLQARWAIVKGPARSWSHSNLAAIMKACIVLHNMIVQDERGENCLYDYDGASDVALLPRGLNSFDEFVARHQQIRCETKHNQLQHDLVEHLWQLKGSRSV